ncbi:alpha/beta hydrolase [Pseudoalteromonas sp. SWN166]|uniref:alpha/beta hydrolase n=1 Tax=Pseudoalteromonas sp. SWN166 TaxID=2792061 RepID=UPI0018CCC0A4|nr:alpha/beta hydrolase-fold protein [Pseudoalteromonas sp. SWN166]MBH0040675.1 alpha/beta hydrolase [Pseudoalteromonas sp. SWN166]
MKNKVLSLFTVICLAFSLLSHAEPIKTKPFSIGETFTFKSTTLEQQRTINVYLPNSYEQSCDKRYPVIYLLDGSKDEDFIHITGLVQFASFSWINHIPEAIVVGIANIDRKHDFTSPSNNALDLKDLPTHGGSKKFISFINDELRPLINKTYRTNSTSTLIGQSLGGLLATDILFNQPAMFNHYVIISPSLWWADNELLNGPFEPTTFPQSVYIGVGKEGELMEGLAKQLHKKVAPILSSKSQVQFGYFENLDHTETLHLAVYDAFKKMNYHPE